MIRVTFESQSEDFRKISDVLRGWLAESGTRPITADGEHTKVVVRTFVARIDAQIMQHNPLNTQKD